MKLAGLDIAVLVAYFVAMIVTGLYFSRKNQSTEEYFVGGRAFSGWIIGLSLVGTSISSATFLAFPADAFRTNWIRFVPNLMLIPVVFIAAAVFLPFFRRGKVTSAYEYLEARFGPTVRVYAAFTFIIAQLFRVSMVLYLVSLVIQQITGFAPVTCILISGGIVAFYAVVGGIDAVIWTDVVQTVVLAVGAVIMLVVIVQGVPGGIGEIVATGWQQGKFGLGDVVDGASQPTQWGLSLSDKTVTMLLLVGLTIFLTEYCANQNVVQRYCAARSTGEARKAMFVCAFTSVPMWAFFMFLGTAMYVFFQVNEHPQVNEMLAPGGTAEHLIPLFIIEYLPAGATGLVIAAALAAAMSSLDSSINAIATVSVVDIVRRHLLPDRSDRFYLRVAWAFATFASIVMVGGAIVLDRVETLTIQHVSMTVVSLLGGGMLGLYLIGFLTRRGDGRAAWCGILATMAFTAWTLVPATLLPVWARVPFDLYYAGMLGNGVMFIIGYAAGCVLPSRRRDVASLTLWGMNESASPESAETSAELPNETIARSDA